MCQTIITEKREKYANWVKRVCDFISQVGPKLNLPAGAMQSNISEAIDNDIKRLKSLVTPGSLSQLTGCVHDTLLGAFIIYSKDGVDMEIFEFLLEEGKVIPHKYSLRCLFRDYDETKVKAMDICDGTQCRLIDLDEPFVPKLTFKDGGN